MFSRLARLATGRPKLVVALIVLFALVTVPFGAGQLGSLSSDGFDDPGTEAYRAEQQIVRASGADPALSAIVLVRTDGPAASGAGAARVAEVVSTLRGVEGVASAVGPAGPGSPQIARDGDAAYVIGLLAADADSDAAAEALEAAFAGQDDVTLGGAVVADRDVAEIIGEDIKRAELIAFPILFLVSLWVFRGVVAALMPTLVGMLTILLAFLGLAAANQVFDVSIYASNLVIGLGLGLAIDYALLIVSRFREEMAALGDPRAAVGRTLATAGRSVFFSALTVAAAMAGLMVFPQDFLASMGMGGVMVGLIAAALALTLLPAVLMLLGPRIDAGAPARWRRAPAGPVARGGWYRLSRFVMARPGRIAALAAVVMILLALPAAGIRFTTIDAGVLPTSSSAREVHDALTAEFPQDRSDPVEIAVSAPAGPESAAALRAYADRIAAVPGVAGVGAPEPLRAGTWQVAAYLEDAPLSGPAQEAVRAIRDVESPYPAVAGGVTASLVDEKGSLAGRLPLAAALIALSTIVILFLLTGSVVLALKAIIMNALTLGATLGILTLGFQEGWLEGLLGFTSLDGVSTTQPLLIAALAFGLSTDYGVFLLSRIKEARDSGLDDQEAVAVGLERTGRIVTAAAVLFVIAMGAFATSRIVIIKELGVGTSLAVLLDATIIRALLVPSLMAMLGRWNWWAPRPLARLHARFGLSEGEIAPAPAPEPAR
ncbi:MAG TPA: MMPL family transporter [Miltoncostaeaceae bacterium]|nr:MMPL family transporter [Miltoncostaeaceae bacterium]